MNHDNVVFAIRDKDPETIALAEPYDSTVCEQENSHFLDCIRKGTYPDCGAEDGLKALEVSHAIPESSRKDQVVTLLVGAAARRDPLYWPE